MNLKKILFLSAGIMTSIFIFGLILTSFNSSTLGGGFRNAQDNVISYAPTSTDSFNPTSNNSLDLGSLTYAWRDGYFGRNLFVSTSLRSTNNGMADIGAYGFAFNDMYASGTIRAFDAIFDETVFGLNGFSVGPSSVSSSTLPNILMTNAGNIWASTTQNMTFLVTTTVAGNGPGFTFDTSDGRGTDKNGGNFTVILGNSTGAGTPGLFDLYSRSGGTEFQVGTLSQLSELSWGLKNGSSNNYFDIGGFYTGGGDWIYGSRFTSATAVGTTSTLYTGTLGQTRGQVCVADSDGSGFTCIGGNNGTVYTFSTSTL